MSTLYNDKIPLAAPVAQNGCQRCCGLMVPEVFPDLLWSEAAAVRCIQCGEIVDSVILKNRLRCPSRTETEQGIQQWHL
jgi:hypothetical protein